MHPHATRSSLILKFEPKANGQEPMAGSLQLLVMDGQRQQVLGLAIVALLILIFVVLRHLWSAA